MTSSKRRLLFYGMNNTDFRWVFTAQFPEAKIPTFFVKVPERPRIQIDEILQPDGTYTPGKQRWLPMLTVFNIPEGHDEDFSCLFKMLSKYYELGAKAFKTATTPDEVMESVKGQLGNAKLTMVDLLGNVREAWTLRAVWPDSVNFGELCYSSSADMDIDITWRFMNVNYEMWNKGEAPIDFSYYALPEEPIAVVS